MFEFILQFVFAFPGAVIRWIITGCKKPFKEHVFNGDALVDSVFGMTFFALMILLIKYFIE